MNCPCSGVYVCAYIVIFFHRGQREKKKSGLVYGSFFLCPLLIPISPQRQEHSEDQLYTTNTDKQTNYRVSFIYQCPIHLQLQDLQIKRKSP